MDSYPVDYTTLLLPLVGVVGLEGQGDAGLLTSQPVGSEARLTGTATASLIEGQATWENASLRRELHQAILNPFPSWKWDKESFRAVSLSSRQGDVASWFPAKKSTSRVSPTSSPPSSLSPSNTASSLYPDGIMTPDWVSRHSNSIPSVVVAFYEILGGSLDPGIGSKSPPRKDPLFAQSITDPITKDHSLCAELLDIKRICSDRGIKVYLVLLIQTESEHPVMEERIGSIRKRCGLDRSSVLIIPKNGAGISPNAFRITLARSISESCLSYYRDHIRRIKKKKARINMSSLHSAQNRNTGSLSNAGWYIRYEFKLGIFSEILQDVETSIRHYEIAYQTLVELFGTNHQDLLAPTSLRWREARIFADCLSLKMSKLFVHIKFPIQALDQHLRHINSLKYLPEFVGAANLTENSDLKSGRKIVQGLPNFGYKSGEATRAYWAWLSIVFRAFAELVDLAAFYDMSFPFPVSGSSIFVHQVPGSILNTVTESVRYKSASSGVSSALINPTLLVQHAGYYYHAAALCAEEVMNQMEPTEREVGRTSPTPPEDQYRLCIIELLTKAYERFKNARSSRWAYILASELSRMHKESGNPERALKFYQSIVKDVRKDGWRNLLAVFLHQLSEAAFAAGEMGAAVEASIELSSASLGLDIQDRTAVFRKLLDIVHGSIPISKPLKCMIDMSQIQSFMTCVGYFYGHSSIVSTICPFQIYIDNQSPIPFRVSKMAISFSNPAFDHIVIHSGDGFSPLAARGSRLVNITDGNVELQPGGRHVFVVRNGIDLTFFPGMHVFQGQILPEDAQDLSILKVSILLEDLYGHILLDFSIPKSNDVAHPSASPYLDASDSRTRRSLQYWRTEHTLDPRFKPKIPEDRTNFCRIQPKQPKISVAVQNIHHAFVDECYGLQIVLHNQDRESVMSLLEVQSDNVAISVSADSGIFHPCKLPAPKELPVISPGQSCEAYIWLKSTEVLKNHVLTLGISTLAESTRLSQGTSTVYNKFEVLVTVSFSAALKVMFSTSSRDIVSNLSGPAGLISLSTASIQKQTSCINVHAMLSNLANERLIIEDMAWKSSSSHVTLRSHPEEAVSESQIVLKSGQTYHHYRDMNMVSSMLHKSELLGELLGNLVVKWKRLSSNMWSTSNFPLEKSPTESNDEISISLSATGPLAEKTPFTITYVILNKSLKLAQLFATIEPVEALIFSGRKSINLKLLPLASYEIVLNCVALRGGKLLLPKLILSHIKGTSMIKISISKRLEKALSVFINPSTCSQ